MTLGLFNKSLGYYKLFDKKSINRNLMKSNNFI